MTDLVRPNLSGWFAHKRDEATGIKSPITRQATCGQCGREYTQAMLSGRFMEIVERADAMDTFMRAIPDLFVPLHCPPCESKDLGRSQPVPLVGITHGMRKRMEDRGRFARNMAQLCAAWNKPMDDETSQVYWRALERAMSDEEFERGVIGAVRSEKKWPTPSVIAQHGRAA